MESGPVHIGCAAGFAGDRFDAGLPVAETLAAARAQGRPAYLMYETLAERTLAIAQRERLRDPDAGYTAGLDDFLRPVLARCVAAGIRIVGNFGAANPPGAARRILALAGELALDRIAVAVVEGDDLLAAHGADAVRGWATEEGVDLAAREVVAANAYLGAAPIAEALATGADVVVIGRCTDSALALGPLRHAFGWAADDWQRLAAGVLAGHLLECGAQVTGGYFAEPGFKDVPDLDRVGYPIAEVDPDGGLVLAKAARSGGLVSEATVKEQILYEIHDPAAYLTPDAALDLTGVRVRQVGPDRVRVEGARGRPPPATLKATVSVAGGWLGEGEISYAGPNALARAALAADTVRKRVRNLGIAARLRCDVLGTVALFDDDGASRRHAGRWAPDGEYRLRVAGAAPDKAAAEAIAREVLSLYCAGPGGGAGVRTAVTQRVETLSAHVPASLVVPRVGLLRRGDV